MFVDLTCINQTLDKSWFQDNVVYLDRFHGTIIMLLINICYKVY
jgi:hypothetical protein